MATCWMPPALIEADACILALDSRHAAATIKPRRPRPECDLDYVAQQGAQSPGQGRPVELVRLRRAQREGLRNQGHLRQLGEDDGRPASTSKNSRASSPPEILRHEPDDAAGLDKSFRATSPPTRSTSSSLPSPPMRTKSTSSSPRAARARMKVIGDLWKVLEQKKDRRAAGGVGPKWRHERIPHAIGRRPVRSFKAKAPERHRLQDGRLCPEKIITKLRSRKDDGQDRTNEDRRA